jgi:diguanylate cyclase (GGDEF)-like protein
MMALLLPVHAAATFDWLVDATATAAERTLNAAFTFVYLEEPDGTLTLKQPASDIRRRSVQRAMDAFGKDALGRTIDPAKATTIGEALDADAPVIGSAREVLRGLIDDQTAAAAQSSLGVDTLAVTKLETAGERLGALVLMLVGTPNAEQVRLLAQHAACAAVNLRQAQAGRPDAAVDVVRTVFDARKTEVELQRELMRAERYRREASICVVEVTNMRLLRERFGNGLVQKAYDRVGEALAQHSRDIDVLGQYKETGYTMVLSEATPEGARQATKRLHEIATAAGASGDVPGLELHFAAGWGTYPTDGKTTDAIFAAAERRMYDPKTAVA